MTSRIDRLVARGRRMARELMTDTVVVARPGTPVTDDDGTVTPTWITVYEGACKVQSAGGIGSESTALGGVTQIWSTYLHLPFDAVGLRPGDVATVTSANPVCDGAKYRLVNPQSDKSHATAVRWNVKRED